MISGQSIACAAISLLRAPANALDGDSPFVPLRRARAPRADQIQVTFYCSEAALNGPLDTFEAEFLYPAVETLRRAIPVGHTLTSWATNEILGGVLSYGYAKLDHAWIRAVVSNLPYDPEDGPIPTSWTWIGPHYDAQIDEIETTTLALAVRLDARVRHNA